LISDRVGVTFLESLLDNVKKRKAEGLVLFCSVVDVCMCK
jgi:hypothetical protein